MQRVFLRSITSFLLWTVSLTAVGFTAVALGAYSLGASTLVCTALFLLVFKGPIYSEASLIYHSILYYFKNQPWWSQITNHLYVSALPLRNFGHLEQLRALGITSVVSINQDFEVTSSGMFHEPVTAEEWQAAGINFRRWAVPDSGAVSREMLDEAVTHIYREIQAHGRVLLHCLAGKGRSVSVAEAYLLHARHREDEPAAHEEMLVRRPQAAPNPEQRRTVVEYHAGLQRV